MKRLIVILSTLCFLTLLSGLSNADLLGIRDARVTMLRVHDVGTKYGPASDQIDVEVVIQLAGRQGSFGFKLRNDSQRPARQGMLDLLRDAFNNDWRVNIDYDIDPPKKNGTIMRVWLTKSP